MVIACKDGETEAVAVFDEGSMYLSFSGDTSNAYPKVHYINSPWERLEISNYTWREKEIFDNANCFARRLSVKSANKLINNWNYYCLKLRRSYCEFK